MPSSPHDVPADDGASVPLTQLRKGESGWVIAVSDAETVAVGEVGGSTISRRLLELGFAAGERVEVVARAWPGGDPMAVRIGAGVFALRAREASSISVSRAQSPAQSPARS
jgi:ferrous iron transport protein A